MGVPASTYDEIGWSGSATSGNPSDGRGLKSRGSIIWDRRPTGSIDAH